MKDVLEQYNTEVLNESKQLSCGKWSCDRKISSKRKKKVKEKVFSVQRETVRRKNYLFLNYMASHELQGSF